MLVERGGDWPGSAMNEKVLNEKRIKLSGHEK